MSRQLAVRLRSRTSPHSPGSMWPSGGRNAAISGAFGEQRQLHRDLAGVGIQWPDRVVAGEAGVAEARRQGVAAGLAHRPVEPVDRQVGEAVDADVLGDLFDIEV